MMYEIDPMLLTVTQGMKEFGNIKNDTDTLGLYRLMKRMCELHSNPNSVEIRREYDNSKLPKNTNVSSYLTTLDDIVTRLNHTLAADQQVPERDKIVHLKAAIPYEVFSKTLMLQAIPRTRSASRRSCCLLRITGISKASLMPPSMRRRGRSA
jgi:hypothetical protein